VKCPSIPPPQVLAGIKPANEKNFAEDFVRLLNDTSCFLVLFDRVLVFSLKVSCSYIECLPDFGTGPSAIWGELTPDYFWHAFHNYIHTLTLTLVTLVVSSTVLYIHCIVPVAHFTTLHLAVLMLRYEELL